MKRENNALIFSATDLSNYINCKHLTSLSKEVAFGNLKKPVYKNRVTEMLQQKGIAFEQAFLNELKEEGKNIVSIDQKDPQAMQKTLDGMQAGADVIYQARLELDKWQGWADFLIRVEVPSNLGAWSYEVLDTKLATETKAGTILQIALYSQMIAELQGRLPEHMHVKKPDGTVSYRVDEHIAYVRHLKKRFLDSVSNNRTTYPEPVLHCDLCIWWEVCNKKRREDDHLGFIAGMGTTQIKEVRSHQVNTLQQMAELALPIPFVPVKGSAVTYHKLREQARLQLQSREQNRPVYEMLPLIGGEGLFKLPKPSHWDIYLDLEGDPLVDPSGREYIFGWYHQEQYEIIWAETAELEKLGFEQFIDIAMGIKADHPEMHIYHYGAYETTAYKRLMCKYATRENEMDQLLRSETFINLHGIVKNSLRAGVEKYSLKDLEKYHGYIREMDLRTLSGLKADYEFLLETNRLEIATEEMRDAIQLYNQDDCISTKSLHEWLERERQIMVDAGEDIPRPELKPGDPGEEITEHQKKIKPIFDALLYGVPPENRDEIQQAKFVLAHMLDWYRREAKSTWWEYYRILDLPEDELLDEKLALTGLSYTGEVKPEKRSLVYCYDFPVQECDIKRGDNVKDRNGVPAGQLCDIDFNNGKVWIKKGPNILDQHPESFYFLENIKTEFKEASIINLANWVLENGLENPDPMFICGRELLLKNNPRTTGPVIRTADHVATAIDWAKKLENSVLPVQGPPGSGKSHTASHLIVQLISDKKKIGITALSHKVINSLLGKVHDHADEEGVDIKIIQKVSADNGQTCSWKTSKDSQAVAKSVNKYDVIAGTPFMWSLPSFFESVDYLFVDEAGQLALIDTLAISHASKNLVLLGDPQQLKQPQKGVHPEGTELSALEHVLNGKKTITREQGLFLSETYRMHPDICDLDSELFYEGKLDPVALLINQRLEGNTRFAGSALFYESVIHQGNTNRSVEEADAIIHIINELCKGDVYWNDKDDDQSVLTKEHIKVITPYNAQVNDLIERIPGVAIGTVDKFQGQEAPVIIFSMATSTPEDAPRGMEFLYSPNRFNVALSRARAVFILVASPAIFEAECKSPAQIRLANSFCRFLEMANK